MGDRSWCEMSNMNAMGTYTDKAVYVFSCHNWGEKGNIKFTTENITECYTDLGYEPEKDILQKLIFSCDSAVHSETYY